MSGDFHLPPHLPPIGFGPGSQPEAENLDYIGMPQNMRTYTPHLPETEADAAAVALLAEVALAARQAAREGGARQFDLAGLSPATQALLAEVLGEGEVSIRIEGRPAIAAQESVFAGVWRLKGEGVDRIEVAAVPALALSRAFDPKRAAQGSATPRIEGLAHAPALLVELLDKSAAFAASYPSPGQHLPGQSPHVINLTLLPHTEADLEWLGKALGVGAVTVLSRGYGNCRMSATATRGVWRVQFFNSMDAPILDTFEVSAMPEAALAASEDLADSAERIEAVLEAIA